MNTKPKMTYPHFFEEMKRQKFYAYDYGKKIKCIYYKK